MSVLVAVKHNNAVYFGADSQVTFGGSRRSLSNPNNYKIWKVKGVDHCIMGSVGRCRDANVIRVMNNVVHELDTLHDSIDFEWVVNCLVPHLFSELGERGFLDKDSNGQVSMNSSFLFGYKDRLFEISTDGCVIEIDDFDSIGSGSSQAVGSLLSTDGADPLTRIVCAIQASVANDIYVDYPIVLCDTASDTFTIINKEDLEDGKNKNKHKGK